MKSINDAIVLIVDDTEENIEILLDALGDEYEVTVAMDGESALEAVEDELPDIILLDVMMPDIDGYEVCRRLKASQRTAGIPVIFLTALTDIKDKTKGFEAGAVDYVTKPFEVSEVRARVHTHLTMYLMSLELEEQREIAEAHTRSKAEFLAMMSHEIRTPMNGVLGMTQLLLETPLNKKQRQFAETIYSSGKSLLSIINDILDYSKLEAGKLEIENIPYSPERLIASIKHLMVGKAQEKELTFEVAIAKSVPKVVLGDANRIRQVLLNFVSNAIKFTGKGSVKIVMNLKENDILYFSVVDTGIGIDDNGKQKLFKDFSQVDSSISRKYGGTGLGLSICNKLVTIMGGEIGVSSAMGQGSEFWFTTPCVVTEQNEIEISESHTNVALKLPMLRILLAEDNKVNQQVTIGMLGGDIHDVSIAQNGVEAVQACDEHVYDVVLMDMQMPDMDGITATIKIRGLENDMANVPIIAITANAMSSHKDQCLAAGMNGFVSKPINPNVLKNEIARVTGVKVTEEKIISEEIVNYKFFDSEQLVRLEQAITHDGVVTILQGYINEVFPLCEGLQNIAADEDWNTLAFNAHKIKGACLNLGMSVLAQVAGEIEVLAGSNSGKAAIRKTHDIVHVLSDTLREAKMVLPEAFEQLDCASKTAILDNSIIHLVFEKLVDMKAAIAIESHDAFMKVSKELLALEIPECMVERLGDIAKYVAVDNFIEAELNLENICHMLEEKFNLVESANIDFKTKLNTLKKALVLAKPKNIANSVEQIQQSEIPEQSCDIVEQVIANINRYQYAEALKMLEDHIDAIVENNDA